MVTKEEFLKYEKARRDGRFNMIMDAAQVQVLYGIDEDAYWKIIENYTKLAKKYL